MDLTELSKKEKAELLILLEEQEKRTKENKYLQYFTDSGPASRDKYKKQMDLFKATKTYSQLALIGANRSGKTTTGAYLMTIHLTGLYPEWWTGRRFDHPISAVAAGDTSKTTRDIQQLILLGNIMEPGTGMIPKHTLIKPPTRKMGTPDAIEKVYVQHVSGGISELTFKSYDQKKQAFYGTSEHFIWLDEEPEDDGIYSECITRTMTTGGIVLCTFTPLKGLSNILLSFLPDAQMPKDGIVNEYKYVTMVSWDDVPHLGEKEKKAMLANYMPHEIEARSKGMPSVGRGKVYPILEDDVFIKPFEIPPEWPRMYGMDVGWVRTAVVWGALDPNTKTIYIYDEYYRGHAEPASHVAAIQARGKWINGAIDYAGGTISEGQRIGTVQQYRQLGLNVHKANKDVEPGILAVYRKMCEGRLKFFSNCENTKKEMRIYRRNEYGEIIKENDHAMDALRYLIMGSYRMSTEPDEDNENNRYYYNDDPSRSEVTGY